MFHHQQSFLFGGSNGVVGVLGIAGSFTIITNRITTTTAGITVNTDGNIYVSNAAGSAITTLQEDWIVPTTAAGIAYECRITGVTGTTPTGLAVNTWGTLDTSRTWSITQAVSGTADSSFTLTIREVANTANTVSATVTLQANNNS